MNNPIKPSPITTVRVSVCLGSSCFARGNGALLPELQDQIGRRGLTEAVELRGHLCSDACSSGPWVRIGDREIRACDSGETLDTIVDACAGTLP